MKIDIAQDSDISELSKLLSLLFEQESEFQANIKHQEKALNHIIKDSQNGLIFKASINNKIVGMVSFQFLISTALGCKVTVLEDMIIHPDFRRQKIGKKLVQHSIDYLKHIGIKRITLLTDSDNLSAHKFYKSLGFTNSEMLTLRLLF